METPQDETLKCERCSTLNTAGSRFCLACGAPLAAEWRALERIVEERLTERVRSVLKENFADQKTLEIETSELIAETGCQVGKDVRLLRGHSGSSRRFIHNPWRKCSRDHRAENVV